MAQGHNLWFDNVRGLVVAVMDALTKLLNLDPTEDDRAAWREGRFDVKMVDCTATQHETHGAGQILESSRYAFASQSKATRVAVQGSESRDFEGLKITVIVFSRRNTYT